jgi:uncharacterized repeat protein (TIGR02543 family)
MTKKWMLMLAVVVMSLVQTVSAQVQTNGALWTMGYNFLGALAGGPTNTFTNQPQAVVPTNVAAVAAGWYHTVFVKTDGSLWAAGDDEDGELGDGQANHGQTNAEMILSSNVTAVAAGEFFTVLVKTDGSLWGMGDNSNGELSTNVTANTNKPTLIVSNGVASVAAGIFQTLWITTNGQLWGVGRDYYGELGDGQSYELGYFTNKPEMIVGSNVTAVTSGEGHTLFLTKDGTLWAMGDDQYGELGDGKSGFVGPDPVYTNRPEAITNGVQAIAAGAYHSLFLMTNGSLWGMGNNEWGQLGNGNTNNQSLPVMIEPGNVVAIACGDDHSLFIKTDGSLWAMGADHYGQLGDMQSGGGQFFGTNLPEMIVPGNVMAISGGHFFSAYIAPESNPAVPQAEISTAGVAVTNGQTNAVSFGTVAEGATGPIVSFTISNTGVATLDLGTPTLPSGFSNVLAIPGTVAPGSSGTFSVQLDTASPGTNSGNISITNNDPVNNPFVFAVIGIVTPVVVPTFTVTATADPADGGAVAGGGSFTNGSLATLTATPSNGFDFVGWTGDATGTNNPLSVTVNTNLSITANFVASSTNLTVTIVTNGSGTVTPDLTGQTIKSDRRYTLTAKPDANNVFVDWTGSITTNKNPLVFKAVTNLVLQANFITNPFLSWKGAFDGLFTNTNGVVTETNAGMLKNLNVTQKGSYTGSLLIGGGTHSLSGTFSLEGLATNRIVREAGAGGTIVVTMALASSNGIPGVSGTVVGPDWTANLLAGLASNAMPAAEYTLLLLPDTNSLPPTNSPGGDGYGLITNKAGAVKIAGALADGTAISQGTVVLPDGYVPIYDSLYSGKGLLLGWINLDLTNADLVGLTWIHPPTKSGLYQDGFTNILTTAQILLTVWTNLPARTEYPVSLTISPVIEQAGTTNPATLTTAAASGTNTGTINPKTGLLTVTIGNGDKKIIGHGAMLDATNGGGYVLTHTNAQAIQITP